MSSLMAVALMALVTSVSQAATQSVSETAIRYEIRRVEASVKKLEAAVNEQAAQGFEIFGAVSSNLTGKPVVVMARPIGTPSTPHEYKVLDLERGKAKDGEKLLADTTAAGFRFKATVPLVMLLIFEKVPTAQPFDYKWLRLARGMMGHVNKEVVEAGKLGFEPLTVLHGQNSSIILRRPQGGVAGSWEIVEGADPAEGFRLVSPDRKSYSVWAKPPHPDKPESYEYTTQVPTSARPFRFFQVDFEPGVGGVLRPSAFIYERPKSAATLSCEHRILADKPDAPFAEAGNDGFVPVAIGPLGILFEKCVTRAPAR
jgi:hypothetical protein